MPHSRLYEFNKNQLQKLEKILVVGDLHGDYDALSSLLKIFDPINDEIIFLGDYADRGRKGIEIIDKVNSLMEKHPENVVALKGNHEDYTDFGNPKFSPCTLISETQRKKRSWEKYFQQELEPFIEKLYLTAIIPDETLFVHGGISSKIKNLDDLRYPTREIEDDILWSDPASEGYAEGPNPRGAGVLFGRSVIENVCKSLGVKRIIRSHQPTKASTQPCYEYDGKVITISSTNVYHGTPFILIVDAKNPSDIKSHF
jgi:hypothetical protein